MQRYNVHHQDNFYLFELEFYDQVNTVKVILDMSSNILFGWAGLSFHQTCRHTSLGQAMQFIIPHLNSLWES